MIRREEKGVKTHPYNKRTAMSRLEAKTPAVTAAMDVVERPAALWLGVAELPLVVDGVSLPEEVDAPEVGDAPEEEDAPDGEAGEAGVPPPGAAAAPIVTTPHIPA